MNTYELWSAIEDLRIGLSDQNSILWKLIGTISSRDSGDSFLRATLESCHTNLLNLIHDIRVIEEICNCINELKKSDGGKMNHTLMKDLETVLEYLKDDVFEYERYLEQDPPIDPKTHIGAELLRVRDWVSEEKKIQELYKRVQERGQA